MIELTDKDFEGVKMVDKYVGKKMMIRCYLPICGRCKATDSVYNELDKLAKTKYFIAQVNCSDYLMSVFTFNIKVSKVPAFAIIVDGKFKSLYAGNINAKEMLKTLESA